MRARYLWLIPALAFIVYFDVRFVLDAASGPAAAGNRWVPMLVSHAIFAFCVWVAWSQWQFTRGGLKFAQELSLHLRQGEIATIGPLAGVGGRGLVILRCIKPKVEVRVLGNSRAYLGENSKLLGFRQSRQYFTELELRLITPRPWQLSFAVSLCDDQTGSLRSFELSSEKPLDEADVKISIKVFGRCNVGTVDLPISISAGPVRPSRAFEVIVPPRED